MSSSIERTYEAQPRRQALPPLVSLLAIVGLMVALLMIIKMYENKNRALETELLAGRIAQLAQSMTTARLDSAIDSIRPEKYSLLIEPDYADSWREVTRVEAILPFDVPITEELVVRHRPDRVTEITLPQRYVERFSWIRVYAPAILPEQTNFLAFTWYDPLFTDYPTIQNMRLVQMK